MHEPDEAGNLQLKVVFGPDGYVDIRRAAMFLLGHSSPTNIDQRLWGLREQLKEEISLVSSSEDGEAQRTAISLMFRLVTLGDNLSPAAKDQARALRSELKQLEQKTPGVKLSLEHTGISDLSEFFESPDTSLRKPQTIRLSLAYDKLKFQKPEQAEIRSSNFVTFYCPAADLVTAARKEGVALFDANVRYELSSSNINQEIRTSASHPKTMRLFHLYNNGVTIIGSGWSYKDNQRYIEVRVHQ